MCLRRRNGNLLLKIYLTFKLNALHKKFRNKIHRTVKDVLE